MRRTIDRLVGAIARAVGWFLFRSVEVVGFAELDERRPRLIVANHFNGFADPVAIAGALGRLPRFIAKATLWKTPGVGILLGAAGVLPVKRTVDGGGDNQGTFAEVVRELHGGETVAIFPEGTTHDNQHLSPVRTGAARLALDAAADGVADMVVVPVGVTFEDKVALRTRVVVRAGDPIDPAAPRYRGADGAPVGSGDHDAVHALTEEIRDGLAAVSPDFDTLLDAVEMRSAARVALRAGVSRPLAEVPLADVEALAKELDQLPTEARDPIATAAAEYDLVRSSLSVNDDDLEPRADIKTLVWRLVSTALLIVVLSPLAIMGIAVNLVPAVVVLAAGFTAKAPVSKGTNRILVGLVVFPITWLVVATYDVGNGWISELLSALTSPLDPFIEEAFGDRGGFWSSLLVFVAAPLFGLLAAWLTERALVVWRTWQAVTTTMNRRGQLAILLEQRRALVELIDAARAGGGA